MFVIFLVNDLCDLNVTQVPIGIGSSGLRTLDLGLGLDIKISIGGLLIAASTSQHYLVLDRDHDTL